MYPISFASRVCYIRRMDGSLVTFLCLGFGLGLVHALDADHVIAVTTLASRRPGFRECLRFAGRWGLGHGVVVLALGTCALALGVAIPPAFSQLAEAVVGAVLVGLGLWVLRDVWTRRTHLHFHEHDGMPQHAHWHTHTPTEQRLHGRVEASAHRHQHGAVLVGALHGAAGTAPFLALLPAVAQGSPAVGIAYLSAFCLGVFLAMAAFGGLFGQLLKRLVVSRLAASMRTLRTATALGSMGIGVYLVSSP